MRRWLALLVVPCLLLAGCGGTDSASALDDVSVSGDAGKAPTVRTGEGFHVDRTVSKVLTKGDGKTVGKGDTVTLDYVGVNGSTGKEFDSSYKSGTPFTTSLDPKSLIPGFVHGLEGKKVGSRTLVAIPPEDGYGKDGNPQAGIGADDTLVFVIDIVSKTPAEASGTKQKLPADLPRIKMDERGHPEGFTATRSTPRATDELTVAVAIKGDGPKVRSEQNLTVQYVGQIYPDGTVFDKSWDRAPASFQIGVGGLIPCWDKGLIGQRVGSRVVLVCPPSEGYGKKGNEQAGIKGTDSLIFAIDILAAHDLPKDG
ncbi:MAG: FKBP-type peptidyl-prolyl cis-trans isomerase [Nocardioidaceae bacterium]